jgi:hypothetical protein
MFAQRRLAVAIVQFFGKGRLVPSKQRGHDGGDLGDCGQAAAGGFHGDPGPAGDNIVQVKRPFMRN